MNKDKITSLAREYAEEIYNGDTDFIPEAEQILEWLTHRFCLVEKSKVEEEYRVAKECLDKVPALSIIGSVINGQIIVLESLFPDLRKEVEG